MASTTTATPLQLLCPSATSGQTASAGQPPHPHSVQTNGMCTQSAGIAPTVQRTANAASHGNSSGTSSPNSSVLTTRPPQQTTGSVGGQTATTPSTTPSSTLSTLPSANASPRSMWKTCRGWLVLLARATLAILGTVVVLMTLQLALWTAVKDFRDDCRSQNVSCPVSSNASHLGWILTVTPYLPEHRGRAKHILSICAVQIAFTTPVCAKLLDGQRDQAVV